MTYNLASIPRANTVKPMEEQLILFDIPVPPTEPARNPGKRFLSNNAAIFESLLTSPTLTACAAKAARQVSRKHGDTRDSGKAFEDVLRDLILEPTTSKAISDETLSDAAVRHPDLNLVKAELVDGPKRERSLADILLVARTHKARTVTVAVNIKRLKPGRGTTEAGSMLQFIQLATEPTYDPLNPPNPVGFDYYHALLEMLAERRRIQDGRDYWLLVARVEEGRLEGLEAWGTMYGTHNNAPIIFRHPNRAVINACAPDSILSADVDPNITVASALLPAGGVSAIRTHIVSAIKDTYGTERAAAAASALLDVDDSTLLNELVQNLGL